MSDPTTASTAETVRPAHTTEGNSPTATQPKAKYLDMSTNRFKTNYGVEAVMSGWRGDEVSEQHGDLNSRDYKPAEGQGLRKESNTPSADALGG